MGYIMKNIFCLLVLVVLVAALVDSTPIFFGRFPLFDFNNYDNGYYDNGNFNNYDNRDYNGFNGYNYF